MKIKFSGVPKFPDYRVSKGGIVQSRKIYGSKVGGIGPWWTMKPKRANKSRYFYVDLFRQVGRPERHTLHELVLITYVGPCPNGMRCRHLDDDPTNNTLDNLCWGTPADNYLDSLRNGIATVGEDRYNAVLTNEQIREIRRRFTKAEPFAWGTKIKFMDELGKEFGVRGAYIRRIVEFHIWKYIT